MALRSRAAKPAAIPMDGGRRTGRPVRLTLLAATAILAMLTVGPLGGQARDAFVAGDDATSARALAPAAAEAVVRRAARLEAALGFPAGARSAVRVHDRFSAATYDEVTTRDAHGRPLAVHRFLADGRVRSAVALGWSRATGSLTPAAATALARAAARHAAVPTPGRPEVRRDRTGSGWTIAWSRSEAGIPVRGDGTWIRLWRDGTVHSVASVTSDLAPDTVRLDGSTARGLVARWVAERAPALRDAAIGTPALAWVAANDLFVAGGPDAPSADRRLAWVVPVVPTGTAADAVRTIEVFVGATDGVFVGGDVLE
jgi:hypothetical protein